MSLEWDRRQLESKQKSQADAAKKAADLRKKEAGKRVDAAKATDAAAHSSNASTIKSKSREAARHLEAANKFGKDASASEVKAAKYGAEAAKLQAKVSKAEGDASQRAAREQAVAARAALQEQRRLSQQITSTHRMMAMTKSKTEAALRAVTAPKVEKLRILMLGASPEGDLRIGREHTKIRRAVEVALHRDHVEIDVRLSATTQDLLEGIAKFRPHVVHFSGHGDDQLIAFEEDIDARHAEGVVVTANAFAAACEATDTPPTLVVFNACKSAATASMLVDRFAPLAIGMAGNIDDTDALNYSTALYSSIANGQSVRSAHMAGKAAIELVGGEHELPQLVMTSGVEASAVVLVSPPATTDSAN